MSLPYPLNYHTEKNKPLIHPPGAGDGMLGRFWIKDSHRSQASPPPAAEPEAAAFTEQVAFTGATTMGPRYPLNYHPERNETLIIPPGAGDGMLGARTDGAIAAGYNLEDGPGTAPNGPGDRDEAFKGRAFAGGTVGKAPEAKRLDAGVEHLLRDFNGSGGMLRGPGEPLPELHRTSGITEASLARARVLLGDKIREVATADASKVAPAMSTMRDAWGEVHFVRYLAEESARPRAVLEVVAGGGELDPLEVDRRTGSAVVSAWFSARTLQGRANGPDTLKELLALGRSLDSRRRLDRIEEELARLDAGISELGLRKYCREVDGLVAEREALRDRQAAAVASLDAIPSALASRLRDAVAKVGGVEDLEPRVREAHQHLGTFPGPDAELDGLEAELEAAAADMRKFRTANPDLAEGPLAKAARGRRDALVGPVEGRRAHVEVVAMEKIRAAIGAALGGDLDAFASLASLVSKVPDAFEEGFRTEIEAIPRRVAVEAGSGFFHAL